MLYTGIGALRGMLREFLSLAVWILAIGSGWLFADAVSSWFELLQDADLRRLLAFLAIVLAMLVALSILSLVLRTLLPRPNPGPTNRGVGAVLGAVRGAAVVVVLVLLAGLTPLPRKDSWRMHNSWVFSSRRPSRSCSGCRRPLPVSFATARLAF